ncbi:MAG: hypothetical protein KKA67_10320 [Spirochaetes bacterium]|nr:hypothetical protein [Spirochaetota bacterium]MBU1079706.1 hypothetical protein [Spirochaetota bacterium]
MARTVYSETAANGRGRAIAGATALALAMALATTASCGKEATPLPPEPPRPGFAVPPGGALALVIGDDGAFSVLGPGAPTDIPRGVPLPFPVAVVASSIQPMGDGAVLAVNRTGLRRLRVARYGRDGGPAEARLIVEPIPGAEAEFPGRTVAPSWARGNEALFLLYRHPIFESRSPRSPASVVVRATLDGAAVMEPGIGDDAYAVFPVSPDAWLAQYRTESGDRVRAGYARLSASGTAAEPLSRAAFERLASPVPLDEAPEPLRAAAAAVPGPLLLEARLPDGSRRAFVRGDPGVAAPGYAQVLRDGAPAPGGIAACIVTDDWRVSIARRADGGFAAGSLYPGSPLPGAIVRDAALVDGMLVALWEEDLFPNTGASGLLVLDPGP